MNTKIKKFMVSVMSISLFLITLTNSAIYADTSYTPPFNVECQGAYLVNLDTGTVVYEKNKDKKIEPASLVKIQTAVVALETIKNIDETTVTAQKHIFDELYGKNGATAGIVKGETLTVRQLLACMLIQSGCEAASMLADAVCPNDPTSFTAKMNARAKSLGAKNTNFINPHGLHEPHQYSSAYDMFLMAKHAMSLPAFMDIVSETSYRIPATNKRDSFEVYTTIDPMKKTSQYYYPPIRGIKTGTEESGRSFVSTATKDGFSYICCVLGAPYKDEKTNKVIPGNKAFEVTNKLYQWAFENFKIKTILTANTPVTETKLKYVFNKDHLKLSIEKDVSALVPKNLDITKIKKIYNLPAQVAAPIKKGDVLGTVKLCLGTNTISESNLVAFETVTRNWFLYLLDIVCNLFSFVAFKIFTIILILCILIFILIAISRKTHRNNKLNYKRKRKKTNPYKKR